MKNVLLAALVATLAVLALARPARSAETGYTECGFITAKWLPEGKPPGNIGKDYVGPTAIPAGWMPIGGTMGSAPAILVCR